MSILCPSALPFVPVARLPLARKRMFHAATLVCALGASLPLRASDVTVQPSAGSGFVVKDASGANERLRVQESGAVSLPSVISAPAQSQSLCMGAGGQLGPCSGGTGAGSYTAATGLTLTGTTFSVAPTYQLPQTCTANEFAQWSGTAWTCGAAGSGATLPIGTVNQTLRYNASNALVANSLLQVFSDGGLVAGSAGSGSIPATGPGIRLMWYPGKAAFRMGYVGSSQWDDANVGSYSAAMGYNTTASGDTSTALGSGTTATGGGGAMAMGFASEATALASMAMGESTVAEANSSTAMGYKTRASGVASTAMGSQTTASGKNSFAMGSATFADADNSIAIGSNVGSGGHTGSFIFGDSSRTTGIVNDKDNQFKVVADGGIVLTLSADGSSNATLNHGDSAWNITSDRNTKTALQPVDPREVLKKVTEIPLSTWRYKAQDADYRHMGPMAQDFYAAFHLGPSDKSISTVDADGVALAAIQGLHAELTERNREIAALREEKNREVVTLRAELAAQKEEMTRQRNRVAALESAARDLDEMKAQLAALRASAPVAVTVASKP